MHSARPDGTQGNFQVHAVNSFSPVALALALPTLPPEAYLFLYAYASPHPVSVALPPAYEGTFAIAGGDAVLRAGHVVEDPRGLGRQRVVRIEPGRSRGALNGSVVWGEGGVADGMGSVRIEGFKRGKAFLDLGGLGE